MSFPTDKLNAALDRLFEVAAPTFKALHENRPTQFPVRVILGMTIEQYRANLPPLAKPEIIKTSALSQPKKRAPKNGQMNAITDTIYRCVCGMLRSDDKRRIRISHIVAQTGICEKTVSARVGGTDGLPAYIAACAVAIFPGK